MVITALDHVDNCYSRESGNVIFGLIRDAFANGEPVVLSFANVSDVPSAFVNAALVPLLDYFSLEFIREHLEVKNSNRQINDMIRRRLDFEGQKKRYA